MPVSAESESRAQLLQANTAAMDALDALLAQHTADELTTMSDSAGWTTKDHLAHLTAWHRSVLLPVRDGISRSRALGVSDDIFASRQADEYFALNDTIRRLHADETLDAVVRDLHGVFVETQEFIATAKDGDMRRGIEACDPDAGEVSVIQLLTDDGWKHLDEHRGYIARILGEA